MSPGSSTSIGLTTVHRFIPAVLAALILLLLPPAIANASFQDILQANAKQIAKSSSKTVGPILEQIQKHGGDEAEMFLTRWQAKELYFIKKSGQFVLAEKAANTAEGKKQFLIRDAITGDEIGVVPSKSVKQIKPNSGVRSKIAATLVPFQLGNPDPAIREATLKTLLREIQPPHLAPLKTAIAKEPVPALKIQMEKAYVFGMLAHGTEEVEIEAAIRSLGGDLSVDVRAALTPVLASTPAVASKLPEGTNLARVIIPGRTTRQADGTAGRVSAFGGKDAELNVTAAYEMMVAQGLAPVFVTRQMRDEALIASVINGMVGTYALTALDNYDARDAAYQQLVDQGLAPALVSDLQRQPQESHRQRIVH